MKELISSFASHLKNEKGRTDETVVKYTGNLKIMFKKMAIYDVAQLHAGLINRRLLDTFWQDLRDSGKTLSDQTRANYLSALKAFLKFCHQYEHLKEDISDKIVIPQKRQVFLEGLSQKEQKTLRTHLARNVITNKDLRDTALIMFLWGTGCRISEALRLNVHPDGYIYFHDESIISGDFLMADGKMYVHFRGKRKKDRRVIVSKDVLAYLNLYLKERDGSKSAILFKNVRNNRSKSERLTRDGAKHVVNTMLADVGIKKEKGMATHIFRHTASNYWLEQGHDLKEVAVMLGTTPETVYKYYFERNKKITDIFGDTSKSTGQVEDPRLLEFEEAIKLRHSLAQ